ncbi:MAG TPA: arginine repressor [Polyangia bacterium]|nr:arginine repressor [Polyangia bacterium]
MRQSTSEARRDAIRELLSGRPIASQGELLRRLGARGIRASQATLSRDMAMLGVRRAVGPDGPRYLVDGNGGALPLDPVRRLVDGVESNGALVIVRTKSSAAATVARALDEAGLTEVMGTLAGDDTVFVAPRRAGGGHRVAGKLRVLFGLA